MSTVLRTSRVALREFTHADLDQLAAMMADKDQMWLYPRPRTQDETHVWIDCTIEHYRSHGYGFWLMESVEDGEFLVTAVSDPV